MGSWEGTETVHVAAGELKAHCLNPFSVAINECHGLHNLQRRELYLAHSSGDWEVQEYYHDLDMRCPPELLLR